MALEAEKNARLKKGFGIDDWWEVIVRESDGSVFAVVHGRTEEEATQRADYLTYNCW
jgi:hypothetical protein